MEGIPVLDEVYKELDCTCLRWSTTKGEDHIAVTGEEMKNGNEVNMVECFGGVSFSAARGVVHLVWNKKETSSTE